MADCKTPKEFIEYVSLQDEESGTKTYELREYSEPEVVLPDSSSNGTATDFVPMFAVMNGIDYRNSYTEAIVTLMGWAGDTAQLYQDMYNEEGTLEELIDKAKGKLGVSGGFGKQDLVSDFDGVNYMALRQQNKKKSFASIFKSYVKDQTTKTRVGGFIKKSFPSLASNKVKIDKYWSCIFETYDGNWYIKILECKYGIREQGALQCLTPGDIPEGKVNNRKAAMYAFADYLFENKPLFSGWFYLRVSCLFLFIMAIL